MPNAIAEWKTSASSPTTPATRRSEHKLSVKGYAGSCEYTFAMPRFNNVRAPQGPSRFDWLPRRIQCLLLLAIMLPATAGSFLAGMHCVHTGKPIVIANRSTNALEFFLYSAVMLLISGGIFGVMMGWLKSGTPHVSETHHRKH